MTINYMDFKEFRNELKFLDIETFRDQIAFKIFGRKLSESWQQLICIDCGKPIHGFNDPVSTQEYFISGLCQNCQDKTFSEDYKAY